MISSAGGAWGAWGQGKVLEMRGPQCGRGKGAGREMGTGGPLRSPHVSRAPGPEGGAMREDSVCQVLF